MTSDITRQIRIWYLFIKHFPVGCQAMVLHENGKMYGGKLKYDMDKCVIGGRQFGWDKIVFVAHDGFPTRETKSNLTDEQFDKLDNTDAVDQLYELCLGYSGEQIIKPKTTKKKTVAKITPPPPPILSHVHYGCPYVMEEVQLEIVNPFSEELRYEETLICTANDGAVGLLFYPSWEIIEIESRASHNASTCPAKERVRI